MITAAWLCRGRPSLKKGVCFLRGVGPRLWDPLQSQATEVLRKLWVVTLSLAVVVISGAEFIVVSCLPPLAPCRLFVSGAADHKQLTVFQHLLGRGPLFCECAESKCSVRVFLQE